MGCTRSDLGVRGGAGAVKRVVLLDRDAIEARRQELLDLIAAASEELSGIEWLLEQDAET